MSDPNKITEEPPVEIEKISEVMESTDVNESEKPDNFLIKIIKDYQPRVDEKVEKVNDLTESREERVKKAGGTPEQVTDAKKVGDKLKDGVNEEKKQLHSDVESTLRDEIEKAERDGNEEMVLKLENELRQTEEERGQPIEASETPSESAEENLEPEKPIEDQIQSIREQIKQAEQNNNEELVQQLEDKLRQEEGKRKQDVKAKKVVEVNEVPSEAIENLEPKKPIEEQISSVREQIKQAEQDNNEELILQLENELRQVEQGKQQKSLELENKQKAEEAGQQIDTIRNEITEAEKQGDNDKINELEKKLHDTERQKLVHEGAPLLEEGRRGEIREWLTKFHETRQVMLDKQKESEGFGVVGGVFEGKEKARAKGEYEKAKLEYETMRAEYVGDKVNRLLNEKDRMAEAQAEQVSQEKGIGGKVYDFYKKMGEWNLGKVLGENVMKKLEKKEDDKWYTKTSKWSGRFASRVLSVRTAVSGAMLGGGLYLGATIGATAGLAAIGARRALSSVGTGFGSYYFMKMKGDLNARGEELKIWKFKFKGDQEKAKLKEMSADEAEQLSNEDILEKMDHFDISGQLNGINPKENPTYKILRKEFNRRAGDHHVMENLDDLLKQEDKRLDQIKGDVQSKDTKRKLIAGGIAIFVGTGGLAKAINGTLGALGISGASEESLAAEVESGNKTQVFDGVAEQTPEQVNVEITPDNISQEQFTAAIDEGGDNAVIEELKTGNPEKYRSMALVYIETKYDVQSSLDAEKISSILEDKNLDENQAVEFLQEKVNDGLLDEYRGEFYPKDTHFEYNVGGGGSIWEAAKELVEENADKLKLAEADYQQVFEAGETKLDYNAWLEQKTNNLVSQLNEAQGGNLADLIHENDVVVLEVGDEGELNLSFEEVSGEKVGHLSDNLASANQELLKTAGFDVSAEVKMTAIDSGLGDKGVDIELANGDHYKVYDWDRDGQPNVIMPDGSSQEMSVAEFQALMEKEGALIKEAVEPVVEPEVEATVIEETKTVTEEIDKMLEEKVAVRQELIEGRDYEDLSAEEKAEYNYTDEEKKILSVKQYLDTYHSVDSKGEVIEYIDSKSDAAEELIKKVEADPSILAYEDVKGAVREIYTSQLDKELNEGFLGIDGPDHEDLYNNTVKLSRTMGLASGEAKLFTEYISQGKELTEDNFEPWLEDGHLSENKFANSVKEFMNSAIHNELPESDKWEPIFVEVKGDKVMALVHQVDDNNYDFKISGQVSEQISKPALQELLPNKEGINVPEVSESPDITEVEVEAEVVSDKTDIVSEEVETGGEVPEELELEKKTEQPVTKTITQIDEEGRQVTVEKTKQVIEEGDSKKTYETEKIDATLSGDVVREARVNSFRLANEFSQGNIDSEEEFIGEIEKIKGDKLTDFEKESWQSSYKDFSGNPNSEMLENMINLDLLRFLAKQ